MRILGTVVTLTLALLATACARLDQPLAGIPSSAPLPEVPAEVIAEPVRADQYNAAFSEALEESGIFAPDTTVVEEQVNPSTGERATTTVNPDGSLISTASGPGSLSEVRCVGPDRCWRRSPDKYDDEKWHEVQEGSVKYASLRDELAYLTAQLDDDPDTREWATSYGVDVGARGEGVFTIAIAEPGQILVNTSTLSGPNLAMELTLLPSDRDGDPTRTHTVAVQPEPVPIEAPAPDEIGAPAPPNDTAFTVASN